jgi:3-oxochol-4-en-24-oyl-CoA dehydrogenase
LRVLFTRADRHNRRSPRVAQTVSDFLTKHQSRAAARSLLESGTDDLPVFWAELSGLGLLGLHISEERGGSGFGLPEVLVVTEQLGRHLAPGPSVPTVIASAVIAAAGPAELQDRLLPGLADGSIIGAVSLSSEVPAGNGTATGGAGSASGSAGVVISGHLADFLLVLSGADVLVAEKASGGVTATVPVNLDPSRRAAKVTLDHAAVVVLAGAGQLLTDVARTVFAAEAAGIASETT